MTNFKYTIQEVAQAWIPRLIKGRLSRQLLMTGYSLTQEQADLLFEIKRSGNIPDGEMVLVKQLPKSSPEFLVIFNNWYAERNATKAPVSELEVTAPSVGELDITLKCDRIKTLDDLLLAANIDQTIWRVESFTSNKWDAQSKDGIVELFQVKARLVQTPVELAGPSNITTRVKVTPVDGQLQRAVIIPDIHFGIVDGEFTHDVQAVAVALATCKEINPSDIVILGDLLDLSPWSSFSQPLRAKGTTKQAINLAYSFLTDLREACPSANIVLLEGNHEARILRSVRDKMPEAEDLLDLRSGRPLLSIENILALDSLDIEYVGPYGASYWLWDSVECTHGSKIGAKGGQSVAKVLADSQHDVVFGHVHRAEVAYRTLHTRTGGKVIASMSPGTLARTDGTTPGASSHPDWQQALGVITRHDSNNYYSLLLLNGGTTIFDNKIIRSV